MGCKVVRFMAHMESVRKDEKGKWHVDDLGTVRGTFKDAGAENPGVIIRRAATEGIKPDGKLGIDIAAANRIKIF